MDFQTFLEKEKQEPYFLSLMDFLDTRYACSKVYPPKEQLFSCFDLCDLDDIKVVIIGQDPYHQPNQAMGMAFSVQKGIKIPPSLVNIYKELHDDLGISMANHGDLSNWAKQGVLLLNTVMSVEDSQPNCHQNKGWETFSDRVIDQLNQSEKAIVFLLWGKPAQTKSKRITNPNHLLIESAHPSPLSAYRGFLGSKPFSKTNAFLKQHNRSAIDWRVDHEVY